MPRPALSESTPPHDDGRTRVTTSVLLAVTEWGDPDAEDTIVLLHGILSSAVYWTEVAERVSGRRVVALDHLGFGSSPRPRSNAYRYADHCEAIRQTLAAVGVRGPVTMVGHSMGALIALRLAAEQPDLVGYLVLIGMPVFASASEARAILGRTWIRRRLLYGTTSRVFCSIWCRALNPLSRRIAPLYLRSLPVAVARATLQHSWRSYSRSLAQVVERQSVAGDLERVTCPTLIVYGDEDTDADPAEVLTGHAHVRVLPLRGGHQLPLERPAEVARLLNDQHAD